MQIEMKHCVLSDHIISFIHSGSPPRIAAFHCSSKGVEAAIQAGASHGPEPRATMKWGRDLLLQQTPQRRPLHLWNLQSATAGRGS